MNIVIATTSVVRGKQSSKDAWIATSPAAPRNDDNFSPAAPRNDDNFSPAAPRNDGTTYMRLLAMTGNKEE